MPSRLVMTDWSLVVKLKSAAKSVESFSRSCALMAVVTSFSKARSAS